jgi:hypothetical protein
VGIAVYKMLKSPRKVQRSSSKLKILRGGVGDTVEPETCQTFSMQQQLGTWELSQNLLKDRAKPRKQDVY